MNLAQENFRLLWAGEWPLWQTIGTALLLIAIAAWLYLGEAKRGTNGRLRWVLPTLRCLALVAIVLTLAGPVLQFQTEEGNRGKITVFLDSSESMDLKDKITDMEEKILLAKEHGFLPEESNLVDYRFATLSRKMENVAELLRKIENVNQSESTLKIIREQLSFVLKTLKEQDDTFSEKKRENSLLEELWFNLEEVSGRTYKKWISLPNKSRINFLIWKLLKRKGT